MVLVSVLDVPSEVKDLEVTDVTADSCVLTWNKPEKDGGSRIVAYSVEKCDANQLSWRSVSTDIKREKLKIENLTKDKEYVFRFDRLKNI